MIGFFPEPYTDELLYSLLSRYYVRAGYLGYVSVAEELFSKTWLCPDIEFINTYTKDALQQITRNKPLEKVVLENTMFPYYARFFPFERKKTAFDAMVEFRGKYYSLLGIAKNRNLKAPVRELRYCPLCSKSDRKQYGETFWHRIHQIRELRICPIHGCLLYSSGNQISSNVSPSLRPAEEHCIMDEVIMSENRIERDLAHYVMECMQQHIDFDNKTNINEFLHYRLYGTKYLSTRGKQRHITALFDDMSVYYNVLKNNPISGKWVLEKVFTGKNHNPYSICMISFFLGISVSELSEMKLPVEPPEIAFDRRVHELRGQGMSYPQIARIMSTSVNVVKPIGESLYFKYNKGRIPHSNGGPKVKNWLQEDKKTLPAIQDAIKQLWGDEERRPKRICKKTIAKIVGIPEWRLKKLHLCSEEIRKHQESQEQYWGREMVWASMKILSENQNWCWTSIRRLTNMRKENLRQCIKYMSVYSSEELVQRVRELL